MNGYEVGTFIAEKTAYVKSTILWNFPKWRKSLYGNKWHSQKPYKKPFLEEMIKGFNNNKEVRFVMCESCWAVGIDHKAGAHGWHYHGHHIWSCPKCKTHDEAYMHLAQEFYTKHTEYVEGLLEHADKAFKACDEDINHPDLWKPGSWMWFFENGGWK